MNLADHLPTPASIERAEQTMRNVLRTVRADIAALRNRTGAERDVAALKRIAHYATGVLANPPIGNDHDAWLQHLDVINTLANQAIETAEHNEQELSRTLDQSSC